MTEYIMVSTIDAVNALANEGWTMKFFQAFWRGYDSSTYYVMERTTNPVPDYPLPTREPGPGMLAKDR